jgi:hypothetical protein
MYSKLICALKTKVFTAADIRILFAILSVGMIIMSFPSDGGGLGG